MLVLRCHHASSIRADATGIFHQEIHDESPGNHDIESRVCLASRHAPGSRPQNEGDGESGRCRLHIVGMLTDRAIVIRGVAAGRDPRLTKVRDVMTRDIIRCDEDEDVPILVEEPPFPGCRVRVCPIGVPLLEDEGAADEKLLAVPRGDPRFAEVYDLKDLPHHWEI